MTLKKLDLSGGTGGQGGQKVYTAPNGVIVTSSAPVYNNSNNYYMEYLFNDSILTQTDGHKYWLTSSDGNQTLTFDFTKAGIAWYDFRQIVVYPRIRGDASSNYRIFYSEDNENWDLLIDWIKADTSIPYGTVIEHDINILTPKYIKFELTRNGSWGVGLDEIEFYYLDKPQPIDNISYSTNQKSVGDTILISWGESGNATRYELQYYFNNEWISINNNITNTEYAHKLTEQNPTAQYRVKGVNEMGESEWVEGKTFEVANQSSIDGEIIINPQNKMRGYIDIKGYGESYIEGELGIKLPVKSSIDGELRLTNTLKDISIDGEMILRIDNNTSVDGEISISPQNRMRGSADIIAPTVHSYRFKTTNDTFVREQAPYVCYGKLGTMLTGQLNENDQCISYVTFDLDKIREDIEIKDIYLKLTNMQNNNDIANIGIYEIDSEWSEDWVKWVNKRELGNLITTKEINCQSQLIKIDLANYYHNNIKDKTNTISFAIVSDKPLMFATKEFNNNDSNYVGPEFIIEYYELVVNGGQYGIDGEIIIRLEDNNEIYGELILDTDYIGSSIFGELELKENECQTEIDGELIISKGNIDTIDGELILNKTSMESSIDGEAYIAYTNDVDAELELKEHSNEFNINGEMFVIANNKSNIDGELLINKTPLETSIDGELELTKVNTDTSIDGSIVLYKHIVQIDIVGELQLNKVHDNNDIAGEISIIANEEIFVNGELELKESNITTEIIGEINIDVPTDIFIDGELELIKANDNINIEAELILNEYNTQTEIEGDILPGILWAHEIDAELIVLRNKNTSEISGEILITIDEDDYIYIS